MQIDSQENRDENQQPFGAALQKKKGGLAVFFFFFLPSKTNASSLTATECARRSNNLQIFFCRLWDVPLTVALVTDSSYYSLPKTPHALTVASIFFFYVTFRVLCS
ncbi:hypothetical protein ABZP36_030200 [Zizania latifolia]